MNDILKINYEKYTLANGLEIILYPDNTLPLTAVNLWYKVGSANERKGKTGFAHLFEHMMFQGSKNVAKQMHFKYIQEAGGNLNGSTSLDRTNYYQIVPSNDLELVLWLESDRMGFLLPALTQEKLNNQIDVVQNERRQRYDNAPYGLAWEIIFSHLYPEDHPYHAPTIGYMEDIASITLDEVKKFFQTYYNPNNAVLVLGGHLEVDKTKKMVENYFGNLNNNGESAQMNIPSVNLTENIKVTHKDDIHLPRIYFTWHSTKAFSQDDAALDVLADLLAGSKNSRLHKSLVFEKEIAQSVTAYQHSAKFDGNFSIIVTAKADVSLDVIKEEIFKEIDSIIDNGITEEELNRSKNGVRSSFIYSMQNLGNLVDRINEYNFYLDEPDSFSFDLNRYQVLGEKQLGETAINYLKKNYVELRIVPKEVNG